MVTDTPHYVDLRQQNKVMLRDLIEKRARLFTVTELFWLEKVSHRLHDSNLPDWSEEGIHADLVAMTATIDARSHSWS